MNRKVAIIWMSAVGLIAVAFGIFYGFFGLDALPVYQKLVPSSVYTQWSNGLYGSVFIGFGVLVFLVGRHAFRHNDKALMKALLYGINAWLIVEAFFSLLYGVYFNVGVDVALMAALNFPLVHGIKAASDHT